MTAVTETRAEAGEMNANRRQVAYAIALLFLITAATLAWQIGVFAKFQGQESAAAIFTTTDGDRYRFWTVATPFYASTALLLLVTAFYSARLWPRTRWGVWLIIGAAVMSWFAVVICAGVIEMIGYQRPFI